MHPSEEIFCTQGASLRGKTIILGITGSIAAVECFALIRDLIRNGADVIPVMSDDAAEIVTPMAMEFASGIRPICRLSGQAEHVSLISKGEEGADLLLIYPATANTISKIAQGICDNAVTSMATVALGSDTPVIMAPAMHDSMYRHPAVQRNLKLLSEMGVILLGPKIEEGRAKVADREEVLAITMRTLGPGDLRGMKVLIIGGRGEEALDDMRVISNRSSGKMSLELAFAAYRRGADVELWMGGHDVQLPSFIPIRRFTSLSDLLNMITAVNHDLVLVPAALPDYAPQKVEGKIDSSSEEIHIRLLRLPKVLPLLVKEGRKVVGFKAESGLDDLSLEKRARERLSEYGLDMVVANNLKAAGKNLSKVLIVTPSGCREVRGSKRHIAEAVFDRITGRE
ncbi:MAG: phosphopantothenoylcysteine decarboxylase / phosphopantothenate---cysteine ligase [Candidatus Methanomethylophilaceae archaeon]|nr:phosphopantothenoylcysteine decarboxylase / phosphopantothenate---cysteine ligase [Candidatus Methanomethylophilaceae archaeon]